MAKHEKRFLKNYESKASEYLNDKEKASNLLKKAMKKADKKAIGDVWENLQLLFSIFGDWTSGKYRTIPVKSILMIIGGILYFVSPVDAITDFIPVAGLLDDATIIGLVLRQVSSDLTLYKEWKQKEFLQE
ncbi:MULTISPECIES: YkvA family protein [Brevibacillus]|uniref:YkvA family protein n=1 Tax=Brevibacillus TaxID=55080 RepID=UPI000D0F04BD|nr:MULTISPECIES: YkvA family protein [Brevibacillus]PSJ66775.1 methyltransferase type 11 [Brevibacillus brevis]RED35908.1 uncharacterized membrane protein YkvA (DUF1232 family) [Brevibacillus brevis]TQK75315.1 uncharacterized membrane protein YkvA (DUF1232 family) [Brevibacillus sp. AG162]VEF88982.1 Uncharacterized conserved protein [Brevibacillus brevis]GEC88393.1 hypothetical protein BBR01nite_07240 [Brevibacillus brevis]